MSKIGPFGLLVEKLGMYLSERGISRCRSLQDLRMKKNFFFQLWILEGVEGVAEDRLTIEGLFGSTLMGNPLYYHQSTSNQDGFIPSNAPVFYCKKSKDNNPSKQ